MSLEFNKIIVHSDCFYYILQVSRVEIMSIITIMTETSILLVEGSDVD